MITSKVICRYIAKLVWNVVRINVNWLSLTSYTSIEGCVGCNCGVLKLHWDRFIKSKNNNNGGVVSVESP